MKYFLDTEFHEYSKKCLFGDGVSTIELISIALIAEDGREYYAVSSTFDVKAAFNHSFVKDKVLRLIHREWLKEHEEYIEDNEPKLKEFSIKNFKRCLELWAKPNDLIAEEIKNFVGYPNYYPLTEKMIGTNTKPEFYAYYADYDWVVFCWLFGRMVDLPNGFPMYCRDIKQMMDEKAESLQLDYYRDIQRTPCEKDRPATFEEKLLHIKDTHIENLYGNEHNALFDARWNLSLFNHLQKL